MPAVLYGLGHRDIHTPGEDDGNVSSGLHGSGRDSPVPSLQR